MATRPLPLRECTDLNSCVKPKQNNNNRTRKRKNSLFATRNGLEVIQKLFSFIVAWSLLLNACGGSCIVPAERRHHASASSARTY